MGKRAKKTAEPLEQGEVSLIPIMNLVCLLIPFLLYTASFVVFSTIDISAQRSVPAPRDDVDPPINLTVVITDQGFRLATSGEVNLPSSCGTAEASAGALHIPLSGDGASCSDATGYPGASDRQERRARRLGPPACAYDFTQLHQCMIDVKADNPNQASVIISGEPGVDYDVLVNTLDATRGTLEEPLFPEVSIAAGLA